ncbi:MAG: colanic acid biosynthesis glycosyltransferase WcaL, partial [Alphaproteobacteria bacterium]
MLEGGVVGFGRMGVTHFALRTTLGMGKKSDRGLLRHLAYLVEACHLLGVAGRAGVQHVHVHFGTNAAAVARLIRRLGGPTYGFTVHGPTELDAPIGFDLRGKISDAAFVVAISDFCRAQLYRWSDPGDWHKIHVVRCTVGEEFFDAAAPLDPASHTFVSIGRLAP